MARKKFYLEKDVKHKVLNLYTEDDLIDMGWEPPDIPEYTEMTWKGNLLQRIPSDEYWKIKARLRIFERR